MPQTHRYNRLRKPLAGAVALLAGLALSAHTVVPAEAATPVVLQRTSATVTADSLPTTQINGIAWAQTISGNTVFAGGEFSYARTAGAKLGTKSSRRYNLLAYDITTGKLKSFAPKLNGPVYALATSPDGKILYVGGNFTKVGTKNRPALAAFTISSGKLRSTTVGLNNRVKAITTLGNTVYFGGWFTRAGSSQRLGAAAINVTTGKLTRWNPKAEGGPVAAIVATKDKQRIVLGGSFATLGGKSAPGMGAVTTAWGSPRTWKANAAIKDFGARSGITALAADSDTVYGTGYGYEAGNFEGVFAASQTDGTIKWLQDCHGDQYSVAPIGSYVYSVGHAHHCSNIGGFGEISPQRALVVSRTAKGTVATNSQEGSNYRNWAGYKAPALYNWFPKINTGTKSGATQGAWSVTGNSKYVVLGGEFTTVNGKGQQGLARFTTAANRAPRDMGPQASGTKWVPRVSGADNGVGLKVGLEANYDLDDTTLTYQVLRNGKVITTVKRTSAFYRRPWLSFNDPGATVRGTKYSYRVRATDSNGNRAYSSTVTVTKA